MVPFHAKGCEIGEPDDVAGGRVADGQGAAVRSFVIARIGAAPKIAVFRNAGAIIWPTAGIGAAFQAGYAQFNFFTRCARNAEVEPLRKLRILVLANAKGGAVAIDGVHYDVTAVECSIDIGDRHFWFVLAMKFMERG